MFVVPYFSWLATAPDASVGGVGAGGTAVGSGVGVGGACVGVGGTAVPVGSGGVVVGGWVAGGDGGSGVAVGPAGPQPATKPIRTSSTTVLANPFTTISPSARVKCPHRPNSTLGNGHEAGFFLLHANVSEEIRRHDRAPGGELAPIDGSQLEVGT